MASFSLLLYVSGVLLSIMQAQQLLFDFVRHKLSDRDGVCSCRCLMHV